MGSLSAMNSINRVLNRHGEVLAQEARLFETGERLVYLETVLENNTYSIAISHSFAREDGSVVFVTGEPVDIAELAERFPDCEVGY
jgi:hypothetical protein